MDGESSFSRGWDIVTSVLLVFVAVVTPFELGFLETRIDTPGGLSLFVVGGCTSRIQLLTRGLTASGCNP
jgi:hypothetical protein